MSSSKYDHNLALNLSDLEWDCFFPKEYFQPDELTLLFKEGFKVIYYKDADKIYAYALYIDDGDCLSLSSVAVRPDYQRLGFGSKLITDLKQLLKPPHIGILASLPESSLELGTFLKKNGFEFVSSTVPAKDEGTDEPFYYGFIYENPNYEGEDTTKLE